MSLIISWIVMMLFVHSLWVWHVTLILYFVTWSTLQSVPVTGVSNLVDTFYTIAAGRSVWKYKLWIQVHRCNQYRINICPFTQFSKLSVRSTWRGMQPILFLKQIELRPLCHKKTELVLLTKIDHRQKQAANGVTFIHTHNYLSYFVLCSLPMHLLHELTCFI